LKTPQGEPLIIGYRFLKDTPFILMIVKKKAELMAPWYKTRIELILFLAVSVTIILSVILCMATYMVTRIYEADQRRLAAIHHAEYANKMASIGRMSASVAHEINNPLAIINEKAGLIQDLFAYQKTYAADAKLNDLLNGIAASVRRAGNITKRLLAFARNLEAVKVEDIDLAALIKEVLSFLGKESEHRGIQIQVNTPEGLLPVQSHRGKLQQIFLNIINNAMAAMDDGGRLEITVHPEAENALSVDIADNGRGIPEEDLHRIFEPFFSTKTKHGGTGLGLSITYNLVQEIGGQIFVESELNKGTRFTVRVPTRLSMQEGD
jgi:two-component system NtrC family sensor kinase